MLRTPPPGLRNQGDALRHFTWDRGPRQQISGLRGVGYTRRRRPRTAVGAACEHPNVLTLVSGLDSAGQARRRQRSTAGAALRIARKAKERTYPELLRSARFRLVVLGIELGGRWSTEVAQFIRLLARNPAAPALECHRRVCHPLVCLAFFRSRPCSHSESPVPPPRAHCQRRWGPLGVE